MSLEYPTRENIGMPSTGDPEEDAKQIDDFIIREKRLAEGICSNGCGPMTELNLWDSECPKCGFTYYKMSIQVKIED